MLMRLPHYEVTGSAAAGADAAADVACPAGETGDAASGAAALFLRKPCQIFSGPRLPDFFLRHQIKPAPSSASKPTAPATSGSV